MDNFINWVVSWINVFGLPSDIARSLVIIALCLAMAVICLFLTLWVLISPVCFAKKGQNENRIKVTVKKMRKKGEEGKNG